MIKKVLVTVAIAALGLPMVALGQTTINVDINTAGNGSPTYSGTAIAPDAGTFWNPLPGTATDEETTSSLFNVNNSFGEMLGVNIVMTNTAGIRIRAFNAASPGAPNPLDLMSDYTYWNEYRIDITGLVAGDYTLYAFGHGDQVDQNSTITLDALNGGASGVTATNGITYRNIYSVAPPAEGYSYLKLDGTVDGSGVFSFNVANYLNGFQLYTTENIPIVVPEPSTFALAGFGVLSLLLARRRR